MKTLRRLLQYMQPHRRAAALTFLCLMIVTVLNLIIPWIVAQVIDIGLGKGEKAYLIQAALLIVAISAFRSLVSIGQRYGMERVGQLISFDLRNALYDHIQRLSFTYHAHAQTGQLMSRMAEDVNSVQRFLGVGLLDALSALIMLVIIIGILVAMNPRLALLTLLPMPFLAVLVVYLAQVMRPRWRRVQQAFAQVSTVLQENLTGVQVVRAFAREPYEMEKFDTANRAYMNERLRTVRYWGISSPVLGFLVACGTALAFGFGGPMVIRGEITLGMLVAINSYVVMLSGPVQRLGNTINMAAEAAASGDRIFEVLNAPRTILDAPDASDLPAVEGCVRFEGVDFRYGDGKQAALHDIDLEACPGQMIALVGHTGSGKSTLVNLILRFYDVTHGRITVDGHDIRDVTLKSLREQIGLVLQDPLLFSATIRENIAYGRPSATDAEVIAAAKAARAHDFISSFPEGYDTVVGERGITLSGGQRQRVAIARALLVNPRILILDDSTSSVDTETEYEIQQALNTLMRGRTSFVIAQRLTTVKNADQVLVLDHGRIAQRGTHAELIAQPGPYREVYDLQLRDQEEAAEAVARTGQRAF
ncbi:MAG: putative multidrug export ATP-binding/permease protein [Chloroflexi bacterium ADurb.Bin325]|nr:MAG: putative multidrug export ATP-binding/permease protein [Chloroflexi bacterium ADurb.Bin325]